MCVCARIFKTCVFTDQFFRVRVVHEEKERRKRNEMRDCSTRQSSSPLLVQTSAERGDTDMNANMDVWMCKTMTIDTLWCGHTHSDQEYLANTFRYESRSFFVVNREHPFRRRLHPFWSSTERPNEGTDDWLARWTSRLRTRWWNAVSLTPKRHVRRQRSKAEDWLKWTRSMNLDGQCHCQISQKIGLEWIRSTSCLDVRCRLNCSLEHLDSSSSPWFDSIRKKWAKRAEQENVQWIVIRWSRSFSIGW